MLNNSPFKNGICVVITVQNTQKEKNSPLSERQKPAKYVSGHQDATGESSTDTNIKFYYYNPSHPNSSLQYNSFKKNQHLTKILRYEHFYIL